MDYKLVLKLRAENDLRESIKWHEKQQRGLGVKFLNHIEMYFEKILRDPSNYKIKNHPFREAFVRKISYVIIYEVLDMEVVIYSVFNTYRNPENKP